MDDLTFDELQAIEARVQEVQQKYGETYDKAYKAVLKQFEAQKEIIENLEEITKNSDDAKAVQEAQLALDIEQLKYKIRFGDLSEKELENAKALLKITKVRNAQASEVADKFDNIFKSTLGITQQTGILNNLLKQGGLKGLQQSMARTLTTTNILNAVISKVAQTTFLFALAQDDALVELNRATNASSKYGDEMLEVERSMRFYGVTLEGATRAQIDMVKNMTNLRNISARTRVEIGKTVALLDKYGISSDLTTKNIEIMTRQMGLTPEVANAMNLSMFKAAKSINMPVEEMMSGFQQAAPEMAKFGDKGVEVFVNLQMAAREAGMEVSSFLSITNQFDRFDTAATAVGKLNAILGGPYLNTLQMVSETDPVARMRALSDAVNSAGKSFSDLSYYERITIANGMGLKDVGELALVMNGNFEDLGDTMATMSEEDLLKLKKESIAYNKVQDEIIQTMKIFIVDHLYPLVKVFKQILQVIQEARLNTGALGFAIIGFVIVLGALNIALKISTVLMNIRIITTRTDTITQNENTIAQLNNINAMYKKIGALRLLGGAMLTAGLGILAFGGGLYLMAQGLYVAAQAFHDFHYFAVAATVAMGGAAVALYFLIPAITGLGVALTGPQGLVAIGAVLSLGLAFLMIGSAVYLAAHGIAAMASSFAELFKVASATQMVTFMAILGVFVTSLAAIALVSIAAIPSLYALGAAFSFLASIDTAKLKPLASVFNSITNMMDGDMSNLVAAKELIQEIADATNSIDSAEKVIRVQQVIDSISNAARGNLVATTAASAVAATAAPGMAGPVQKTTLEAVFDFGNVKTRKALGTIIGNYTLDVTEGKIP